MRKSFFPSILLISLMALNLAFLSCGGNDSDTKLKGIFDGIGPWNGSATNSANGDQLYMSFTNDNNFTLDITDSTNVKLWKVVGKFVTKDGKLSLEPTGYYDLSANPDKLVDFATAPSADKQAIEAKLTETFGDYKAIGYDSNNNNITFSDENSKNLFDFTKDDKSNFIPPADPVNPNDPIYEDDDEVINLTEWLNDPANNWTVGKPGKKTTYEYTVSSALNVPSGTVLKILPATTITFTQQGASLVVQSGGGIEAEGTASGHIVFKSSGLTKGSWSGITIQSNYTTNKLDYVEIINAGRTGTYPISITAGNSVSITNSIIDGSTTNGIRITGTDSVLTAFDNNTIKNCDSEPIYTDYLGPLRNIGKNNIYDATNTLNRIRIGNNNSYIPTSTNMTIKNIGIPYYFQGGLSHNVSASTITIEAGVEILVNNNVGFTIGSSSKLVAIGTDQQPITFKPLDSTATKGSWDGITFNSSGNELDYVSIINAGRVFGSNEYSPIRITINSSASITNSIIDGSTTNGISITGDGGTSVLTEFDNNTIKNCNKAPIYTAYLWPLRNIGKNNIYDDTNTLNRIDIGATNNNSMIPGSNNMTIKNIGIPYYFSYGLDHSATNSTLTIEAGVNILVGNGRVIIIGANSKLVAIGTLLDRIKIQGLTDDKGYWKGVQVYSGTPGTKFAYCDISGGGYTIATDACLVININALAQLKDVKLSKSTTYGLRLNGGAGLGIFQIWAEDVTFGTGADANDTANVYEYKPAPISSYETNSTLSNRYDFPADPL